MANLSSSLARRIPWTEEPGGLQSMGSQRVGHDCNDLACTHAHTHTHTHTNCPKEQWVIDRFMYSFTNIQRLLQ